MSYTVELTDIQIQVILAALAHFGAHAQPSRLELSESIQIVGILSRPVADKMDPGVAEKIMRERDAERGLSPGTTADMFKQTDAWRDWNAQT
jgi:hypothetical protein